MNSFLQKVVNSLLKVFVATKQFPPRLSAAPVAPNDRAMVT
jgi:hypothetical protein